MEGRRGARGGVVPRDGEGDAVLGCGGGVGVAGLWRGGDGLGCGVGLRAEGWGGGGGCGGGGVSAFRVDCAGAGDVAALSPAVSAVAFVLVPSSALPVSLFAASACACCSAVA